MNESTSNTVEREHASISTVELKRWPAEIPLFLFVLFFSLFMWIAIAVTIIGAIYAVIFVFSFFLLHLRFITYLRGSGVELSEKQFPEIYSRFVILSKRAGMKKIPEAYILQSEGAINAFATKFMGRKFVVLYTDLLEACEGNESALDMIIGHELAHVKAGHLRWLWLITPGLIFPFIGSAYSRAREFTCDRYGTALCGSIEGARHGLTMLAVGGKRAKSVELTEFVKQQEKLNTGLMTLGKWLSPYPPLCQRVAAIDPDLVRPTTTTFSGFIRAILTMLFIMMLPIFIAAAGISQLDQFQSILNTLQNTSQESADTNYDNTDDDEEDDDYEYYEDEEPVVVVDPSIDD